MRATETIYREMLAAYAKRRGGQLQEDCDLSVRLWAAAAQIQALEAQAEWVLGQSFPQTAAGVYLDRHGAMRGIVRQAPSRATGQLTFRLSNAQTGAVSVETGTVCMTEGTVRFRTTEPGTIPAGEISVTVAAEAVETGSSGNVGAGTVHVLTACPVAVTAVTNEKAFTGGLSEETDEELRQRILDSFQRLPNGANAAWYELTARLPSRGRGGGQGGGKSPGCRDSGCVCIGTGWYSLGEVADRASDGFSEKPGDRGERAGKSAHGCDSERGGDGKNGGRDGFCQCEDCSGG